jgi:hypothetical protein
MRKSTATLAIGCLLLSAGCGGGGTPGPDTATTSSEAPEVPEHVVTLTPGTASPQAKPSPVTPQGGTVDPRPVPWLSAKTEGGGDRLRLVWWSGVEPCHVLDRVAVQEGREQVKVTIYEGASAKEQNIACIEIAVQKTTTVDLDSPLGDREIVDGAKK